MTPQQFRSLVWKRYRTAGRHDLPWRQTIDPYRILVSEVMLQQTQVERVIPYYGNFLRKFPTIRALAKAPLGEVLIAWQGLGYNRRAKMLHEAAEEVVENYKGKFPEAIEELEKLRGVGHYTARAVAAFAYNVDAVFIETNIRTAVTHHFFPKKKLVDDKEILHVLEKTLPKGKSREWHAALMDYGSFLKSSGIRINSKSKTYTKQSVFKGSDREARGAILKTLAKGPQTKAHLLKLLENSRREQLELQLQKLLSESIIEKSKSGSRFHLPG